MKAENMAHTYTPILQPITTRHRRLTHNPKDETTAPSTVAAGGNAK